MDNSDTLYPGAFMYNALDHYWMRSNGRVFSSRRCIEVDATDEEYLLWLGEGKHWTAYPTDPEGNESVEELDKVLAPHGLRASPMMPIEQRKKAYEQEADALRDEISGYREEADARREAGDEEGAAEVEEWARNKRARWLEIREEIRLRFPDEQYILNASGTYHLPTCGYVGQTGQTITLAAIHQEHPNAKPCSRCTPPALVEDTING